MPQYITLRETRRGLTLTELVTVLAIMSFIATIILMVFTKRMSEARLSVAAAECKMLANAEETVAIEFGFYVPLQVLNDQPIIRNGSDFTNVGNQIHLEPNTVYLINANTPIQDQAGNQAAFGGVDNNGNVSVGTDGRVARLIKNWRGPYASFQRFYVPSTYTGPADRNYVQSTDARLDYPLDPWGVPYFLYSPYGPVGGYGFASPATPSDNDFNQQFGNGRINTNISYENDRFAVVSWGPNGLPDYTQPDSRKDDVYYYFGGINRPVNNVQP